MRMSNEVEVVAFLAQESRGFAYTKRQMPVHRNSFIVYSHAVPNSNSLEPIDNTHTHVYIQTHIPFGENRTHLINAPPFSSPYCCTQRNILHRVPQNLVTKYTNEPHEFCNTLYKHAFCFSLAVVSSLISSLFSFISLL